MIKVGNYMDFHDKIKRNELDVDIQPTYDLISEMRDDGISFESFNEDEPEMVKDYLDMINQYFASKSKSPASTLSKKEEKKKTVENKFRKPVISKRIEKKKNKVVEKEDVVEKPKKENKAKASKEKNETKPREVKPKKSKEQFNPAPSWFSYIRKFTSFYANKNVRVESLTNYVESLQDKFQANPKRKPTPHLDLLVKIQDIVVKTVNKANRKEKVKVNVSAEDLKAMKDVVTKYTVARGQKRIYPEVVSNELSGVKKKIINSNDLRGMDFNTTEFEGNWGKSIGKKVELPFSMMIYGKGGSGKSSYAIQFARFLSKQLNKKVLYIADEEKVGYLLNDKLERFNAHNNNLKLSDSAKDVESDFNKFDFVFFDSVTNMGLQPAAFEKYKQNNPHTSFVAILQATKEGTFRGSNEWEHLVDVKIKFENGISYTEKSRFGGTGQVKVW